MADEAHPWSIPGTKPYWPLRTMQVLGCIAPSLYLQIRCHALHAVQYMRDFVQPMLLGTAANYQLVNAVCRVEHIYFTSLHLDPDDCLSLQVTYLPGPLFGPNFIHQPHRVLEIARKQGCGTLPNLQLLKLEIDNT